MNPTTATNRSDGIPPDGSAGFHTTHWSVVLAAGERSLPSAQDALARLCQEYWYPLYAHVRRRGNGAHEAQDLTQAFFARLLEQNSIQAADKERGRFRSFLLASLNNFLNNEWNRNQTARRGGGGAIISWDAQTAEERYVRPPFSVSAAVAYLNGLSGLVSRKAFEYINKAPVEVVTPLRRAISAQGANS